VNGLDENHGWRPADIWKCVLFSLSSHWWWWYCVNKFRLQNPNVNHNTPYLICKMLFHYIFKFQDNIRAGAMFLCFERREDIGLHDEHYKSRKPEHSVSAFDRERTYLNASYCAFRKVAEQTDPRCCQTPEKGKHFYKGLQLCFKFMTSFSPPSDC
jgi:hypothetical protein